MPVICRIGNFRLIILNNNNNIFLVAPLTFSLLLTSRSHCRISARESLSEPQIETAWNLSSFLHNTSEIVQIIYTHCNICDLTSLSVRNFQKSPFPIPMLSFCFLYIYRSSETNIKYFTSIPFLNI